MRIRFAVLLVFLATIVSFAQSSQPITEQELVRRTQELFDAVAPGNKAPWTKYIAADCTYFDEKGRWMDKKALIDDLSPMPKGYSGTIKVAKVQSRIFPTTAVLSYDLDETETIYGQDLKARYHETDTWLLRNGEWQIVAAQVLRYYEDPAPGSVTAAQLEDFLGTYELTPGITMKISREGDQLFSQRGERPREQLIPETPDIFFRKGIEGRRLFRRNQEGKVDALIDRRNNEDVTWKKL